MSVARSDLLELLRTCFPFNKMDGKYAEMFADYLEEQKFYGEDLIYGSKSEGDALYLVIDGKVSLFRHWKVDREEEYDETVATCSTGDYFGYEVLEPELSQRLTGAKAVGSATVMRIERQKLADAAERIPGLYPSLKLLYDSFRLSLRVQFPWRNPEETIYFVARRHPFILIKQLIGLVVAALITLPLILWLFLSLGTMWLPLILLIADGVILIGWLIWTYADWYNDFSIITNQRVAFQEKIVLFYDSRQEVPLYAIQVVSTDTDQWGRWIGYGDVLVRSFAGSITLSKVNAPSQVAALLEAEWYRARLSRTRQEKAAIAQIIRQRLGMQPPSPAAPQPPVPAKVEPGPLQKLLANLFQLRFEKGSTITYRTHWFLLLTGILPPTLVLLGLAGLVAARILGYLAFVSLPAVFGLALLIGLGVLGWWVYRYVDWRNDYYVITDDQIMDVYKKPLGLEEKKIAPIKNIMAVEFSRKGIIGLLLNFGTVSIRVGDTLLTFDDVFNPAEVQRELFRRIADRDYKEKQASIASEQQRVLDLIEIYHKVVEEQRSKRPFAAGRS